MKDFTYNIFTLLVLLLNIFNSGIISHFEITTLLNYTKTLYNILLAYLVNHKNIFLLNDTCEIDRLLVPAYDWNMSFFTNKRLK